MPDKHPNTDRIGGPGAAHENRKHPEKSQEHLSHASASKSSHHSKVSGGGGEKDSHHTHSAPLKGGK
jgi:hypothetical protein